MIVTCPSCSTRYAVDPTALGKDGRQVKCARCSHQWFQPAPPAEAVERPEAAPAPSPAARPRPIPPGSNLPAPPRPRRRKSAAAGWMLLLVFVAGVLAVGYVGRGEIVRLWPPATKLYEELGVDVAAGIPGVEGIVAGLALANVASERTDGAGGPVVWVRGEVANRSAVAREVPPLQVELTDGDGNRVANWTFSVEPATLAPGETARFETSQRNVDGKATKLTITVAR